MRRTGGRYMRKPKRKVCHFCVNKIESIDYKDFNMIKKYISERGKILPRRISGNCAKHQRALTAAVKKSRVIAIIPYV